MKIGFKRAQKITKMIILALVFMCMINMSNISANAAPQITMTVSACTISGGNVVVTAVGTAPVTQDGMFYLFDLKPYETGIGNRKDYCATALAAPAVSFSTPLNHNTVTSKLYSRFVVAVLQNGKYQAVSNDMYITNPEAVATKTTSYPVKSKKGLTADWRYSAELSDLGAGFASYELDVSRFFMGAGVNYVYNGKPYSFNAEVVREYDIVCQKLASQGCNVVMIIKNGYHKGTLDMIPAGGRVAGKQCYAFNVDEQIPTEKLEALMSFLANRYSGTGYGSIHTWIIGNEVNTSNPWHYMGNVSEDTLAAHYAKEFRVCYNAIKSQNSGARVFISIDQRWTHVDGTKGQFKAKNILDKFATYVNVSGNIDWGLSFHPYPVPIYNATFWSLPPAYARMNLIDHTDDTKMLSPLNCDVVTNHMLSPVLRAPGGAVRHMIISEMGFTSYNKSIPSDELRQAAALVYAYKLTSQNPFIEGVIIHRHVDHASEVASDGMAVGIRTESKIKYAYAVFKNMDKGNSQQYTDFALPLIGAASWAQLGLQ